MAKAGEVHPEPKEGDLDSIRDTVESIWVAIVVAFVLRAFLVEAFVIPTGSMAPRLLGEHWDLQCASCGWRYAYGHNKEAQDGRFSRGKPESILPSAHCPNCGYQQMDSQAEGYVNSGDRVLVLKYLYPFREPKPWEVVVFKNPQNNLENYIKRLIGLPGEQIEIVHGDVFFREEDGSGGYGPWRIRRKPVDTQQAMWHLVFDNDYRPNPELVRDAPRWAAIGHGWQAPGDGGRTFSFQGAASGELRFVASAGRFWPQYGYNAPVVRDAAQMVDTVVDVCTDLRVEATFVPHAADSRVGLQITALGQQFRGEVSGDGAARLLYRPLDEGSWRVWGGPRRVEGFEMGRGCDVALDHVDLQVRLWVDGRIVLTSSDEQYPISREWLTSRVEQREPIEVPEVCILAEGGPLELRHLRLLRDVYYTSPHGRHFSPPGSSPPGRYYNERYPDGMPNDGWGWGTTGHPITLRRSPDNPDLDEFFVLGDNSPNSKDSRLWVEAAPTLRLWKDGNHQEPLYKLGTVPRYNLIGKAFFVYWPSGFRVPGLASLPLIPNVGKMRVIH